MGGQISPHPQQIGGVPGLTRLVVPGLPSVQVGEEGNLYRALGALKESDVPKLKFVSKSKPADLEEWLNNLSRTMDGIHPLVSIYCQYIKTIAENAYERYLYLSQTNRIGVRPEERTVEGVYQLIERKLRVVIFTVIPYQIAKASQQVGHNTCTDMLFNTMIDVAPGNKADREAVHADLIAKKECEPRAMHDQLHKWKFNFNRLMRFG